MRQCKTGSISSSMKYHKRRLMVNLARRAALLINGVLPNASINPLDQAHNIGTATDPQQQQSSMASSANDRGDSQQSNQPETSASSFNNGMSPDQITPNSRFSSQPDTQQFSPHYQATVYQVRIYPPFTAIQPPSTCFTLLLPLSLHLPTIIRRFSRFPVQP